MALPRSEGPITVAAASRTSRVIVVEGDGFQLNYTTQNGNMKWGSNRQGAFSGSNWNWLNTNQLVVTVGPSNGSYGGGNFWIANPDGQDSDCVTIGFQ